MNYKLLIIIAIGIVAISCETRNSPNENPQSEQSDNESSGKEDLEQPQKYLKESWSQIVWVNDTSIYKDTSKDKFWQIYERESDPKFKKSLSVYDNDRLRYKIEYKNDGKWEYGTYVYYNTEYYPYGAQNVGKVDTTLYYDDERTQILETRSDGSRTKYFYNHNGCNIGYESYSGSQLIIKRTIIINGKFEYGKTENNSTGNTILSCLDTLEYNNEKREKVISSRAKYFDTQGNCITLSRSVYNYHNDRDCDLITDTYNYQNGAITGKNRNVTSWVWHNDLLLKQSSDVYNDGIKMYTNYSESLYVQ